VLSVAEAFCIGLTPIYTDVIINKNLHLLSIASNQGMRDFETVSVDDKKSGM
jgi:hypothetical protein